MPPFNSDSGYLDTQQNHNVKIKHIQKEFYVHTKIYKDMINNKMIILMMIIIIINTYV